MINLAMNPEYIQQLHTLLEQSSHPDTALIKAATATLNQQFYKDARVIPGLFQIIATSSEQSVRQLASVELRKRISQKDGEMWTHVPQDVRNAIKEKITQVILVESIKIVRHSIARVISVIADIELPLGTWPSLLPWVFQSCTSTIALYREIGIFVLFSALDNVVEGVQENLPQYFKLFANLLQDPESFDVRATTVRALGTVAQYVDIEDKKDIKEFQTLIPLLVNVLAQAIEQANDEAIRQGFDVIETLLILETPLLAKHIPDLVDFFLKVAAQTEVESDTRVMSLNSLVWTIKYKKSKIQSLNLAKPIMERLFPIGTEEEPDDPEEESPCRIAFRAIDALATALPPAHVFPPLTSLVQTYIASPDPHQRKAALMAFGVTVEGCSEYIKPHINEIWPLIDAGLADPSPVVRKAACMAVSCLCEWLEEECAERHAVLMPAIIHLVQDTESQASACSALDAVLEILGPLIQQYLAFIMERLAGLLETAPLNVKAIVTGAIGSAAHASGSSFQPYFIQTLHRLQPFLTLMGQGEEMELRGIAMDAIGTIAESVGKEEFRPYLEATMKVSFQALMLDSPRLKECSFLFWGVMARLFQEEFAVYMNDVVPPLILSLKQAEGGDELSFDVVNGASTDAFATGESSSSAIKISSSASSIDDLSIDDLSGDQIKVNSAVAVEKEIAADTLGTVFVATKNLFLPFLESSTEALIDMLNHYYEGIRKSSISSLLDFIQTFYELSNPAPWEPGLHVHVPLHEKVLELANPIFVALFEMWDTEDDRTVVSQLCQGLCETIAKVGPGLLQNRLDVICTNLVAILEGRSMCQQDPDQEDEEESEEQAEYDSVLISSASDLVSTLASALGPDFSQAFGAFMPLLFKYSTKNRSVADRTASIGCLGEIITGMKGGITPFTEPLLDHIFKSFADPEYEVRSNAAFAAGVLVENTDQNLSPQYLHLLAGLQPFFVVPPEAPSGQLLARDNAAGAVARMILKHQAAVPLDQVLPVLLGSLPLKNDYLENRPVFRCIFHLFRTDSNVMMQHLDTLIPVFAHVLDPSLEDQIGDEVRAELIQLLSALNSQVPQKIAPLAAYVQGS